MLDFHSLDSKMTNSKLPTVIEDKIEVDHDINNEECSTMSFTRDLMSKEHPWAIQSTVFVESLLDARKKDEKHRSHDEQCVWRKVRQGSALGMDRSDQCVNDSSSVKLTSKSQQRGHTHEDDSITSAKKMFPVHRLTQIKSFNVRSHCREATPTISTHAEKGSRDKILKSTQSRLIVKQILFLIH